MIKDLWESYIRLVVQQDGVGFNVDTGIVNGQLAGSCVICPSIFFGNLETAEENKLMRTYSTANRYKLYDRRE